MTSARLLGEGRVQVSVAGPALCDGHEGRTLFSKWQKGAALSEGSLLSEISRPYPINCGLVGSGSELLHDHNMFFALDPAGGSEMILRSLLERLSWIDT